MKIYLENLGCPKNQVDGERILAFLRRSGAEIVDLPEEADAILVNTCAFIEAAREESVETILELAELKKRDSKRLFVIGCLAQRYQNELSKELREADGIVGERDPRQVAVRLQRELGLRPTRCDRELGRHLLNPPHYAYLKLAEGCDNRCAYCSIPLIKGRYRSRPLPEVVEEARQLVERGVREINLVAQDVTYYGWDRGKKRALIELLEELARIDGLRWIRLLYAHPAHLDRELVTFLSKSPKVCRYIDLPTQHASDRILKRMGRRITRAELEEKIQFLRSEIPEVVIRTTVLVGFPGETDEDFEQLLDFLAWARFERIGVFGYSREDGTRAAMMSDQVAPEVITERVQVVSELAESLALDWFEAQAGRELVVLVDGFDEDRGTWIGRTEWDAPEIDGIVRMEQEVEPGQFVVCRIQDTQPFELLGVPLGVACQGETSGSGSGPWSEATIDQPVPGP